jgi:ketosteroid isomerase-like protein
MKRAIRFVAMLGLLLTSLTVAQSQTTSKQAAALRAQILAVNAKIEESCGAGNTTAISTLFADDAQILVATPEAAKGRSGVQSFFRSAFNFGVKQVKLDVEEVGGEGNLAYQTGNIALYNEKGEVIKQGRYVILLKRVKKQWKIFRLMSNDRGPAR